MVPAAIDAGESAVATHVEEAQAPVEVPPADPPNPLLEKFNELTKAVHEKPDDFPSWTSLLSTVDKLDDLSHIRATFDSFLAAYPLCYGYWKKYAEAERRHGSVEAAVAVYQRGAAATPYSQELWLAYLALLQATDAATDTVRSVYEQAVSYVGPDWLSSSLWEKYLAFEGSHGSPAAVAALYARVLACPVKELDKFHDGLVSYAGSRTADELLPQEARAVLRDALEKEAAAKQAAAAAAAVAAADAAEAAKSAAEAAAAAAAAVTAATDGDGPAPDKPATDVSLPTADADTAAAAVEQPDTAEAAAAAATADQQDTDMPDAPAADAAEQPAAAGEEPEAAAAQPPASSSVDPQQAAAEAAAAAAAEAATLAAAEAAAAAEAVESDDAIKAHWLQQQQQLYQATKEQQRQRQQFEECIRRPYWHVKPLDAAQLKNWVAYLDWQEAQGDVGASMRLYERCLVPCANYPGFWQRYVLWCEAHQPDAAATVLARATAVFCRRSPEFGMFAARFLEAQGQVDAARQAYKQLLEVVSPGLLQGVLAAANFERRVAGAAAACAVFDQLLQEESAKDDSSTAGFACVLYANFLWQVCGNVGRAREVLRQGLSGPAASCKALWEGALFFEESLGGDDRVQRVLGLYDQLLEHKQAGGGSSSSSSGSAAAAGTCANADAGPAAAEHAPAVPAVADDGTATAAQDSAATGAAAGADTVPAEEGSSKQCSLPDDVLEDLSKRCVDFADMYADIATLARVLQRHAKLFMLPANALSVSTAATGGTGPAADADRKRAADSGAAAALNGPVSKVARTDAPMAAPAAAAAAAAAAATMGHDAAGYYQGAPVAGGYGGHWQQPAYGYGHPHYGHAPGAYGYGYDRGYDRYGGY